MFIWLIQKLRTSSNLSSWPSPPLWWMWTFAQQRSVVNSLLPSLTVAKKAILIGSERQSFAAMSELPKEVESSGAQSLFAPRTSAEDDDGQDVRDLLSKHKTCVYMPPLTQSYDNSTVASDILKSSKNSDAILGLSGSRLPKARPTSQFNVFHQLGTRPFSQHAASLDETVHLDDTTQQREAICVDDEDEIVFLNENVPGRDNDDIVFIEEKRSTVLVTVPTTKSPSNAGRIVNGGSDRVTTLHSTDISSVPRGTVSEVVMASAYQQKMAENRMDEASITQIANEYGEMSMEMETETNTSTSSDSFADDAAVAHSRSPRSKNIFPQSPVTNVFKKSPQSYESSRQQQSNQSPSNNRQLHTSAGSMSASRDDDVTFLLERKAPFTTKSTAKRSPKRDIVASPFTAAGHRTVKDDQVRDMISAACRANGRVRSWQSCRPPKSPPLPTKNVVPLTICSYNVLCQTTIGDTAYLYGHLSGRRQYLDWAHRSALLCEELPMLDADIFCLQEVQADHYNDFYLPLMTHLGYDGQYKRRTGEKADGCATFWRKSKLEVQQYRAIEYNVAPNSSLDRDNVGMIVTLKVKGTQAKLLVANTHLLFNESRGDVKLAQLALLFAHLEQMSYTGEENFREELLICGDFNMEPLSPIYEFIVAGDLDYAGLPQFELSGQGRSGGRLMPPAFIPPSAEVTAHCLLLAEHSRRNHPTPPPPPTTGSLRHQFNLMSVYRHKTTRDEFELSTYHSRDSAMPDFIFYSLAKKSISREENKLVCRGVVEGRLKCVRRLELPDLQFMKETVGRLPNQFCPSDHLPLLADFLFDTS